MESTELKRDCYDPTYEWDAPQGGDLVGEENRDSWFDEQLNERGLSKEGLGTIVEEPVKNMDTNTESNSSQPHTVKRTIVFSPVHAGKQKQELSTPLVVGDLSPPPTAAALKQMKRTKATKVQPQGKAKPVKTTTKGLNGNSNRSKLSRKLLNEPKHRRLLLLDQNEKNKRAGQHEVLHGKPCGQTAFGQGSARLGKIENSRYVCII